MYNDCRKKCRDLMNAKFRIMVISRGEGMGDMIGEGLWGLQVDTWGFVLLLTGTSMLEIFRNKKF